VVSGCSCGLRLRCPSIVNDRFVIVIQKVMVDERKCPLATARPPFSRVVLNLSGRRALSDISQTPASEMTRSQRGR
jgi:hypothetical protein